MNSNFSIIWGTRQIRNQQILLYTACAVKQLRGLGIEANTRVAICDENSVEYIILLLALWQLKAVAVPISPRWPEKMIIAYAARTNAQKVFYSADIKRLVCFDARQQVEASTYKDPEVDQEVTIIATSGSSGEAKAAVLTWGNHFYNAKGSNELMELNSTDRWLLSLPLFHVAGLGILSRCLIAGAGAVIAHDEDLIVAIEKARVTHVSLVATQLLRLLANEDNFNLLRSLKCILIGGSAIPLCLIEQGCRLGLNIYISYGLTEMASQVATGQVGSDQKVCVKPLAYRQVKISKEGEILVKGQTLFKGYVTGTRLTLPLREDDWFGTGDIGEFDPMGGLKVSGRRDSMFISGGENVHPEEIEKALLNIKGIAEAMVVPREDKEFGHRPIAFVRFSAAPLAEQEIIRQLQESLPRFKIPVAFLPWPQHLMAQGIKISRQDFLKNLTRR